MAHDGDSGNGGKRRLAMRLMTLAFAAMLAIPIPAMAAIDFSNLASSLQKLSESIRKLNDAMDEMRQSDKTQNTGRSQAPSSRNQSVRSKEQPRGTIQRQDSTVRQDRPVVDGEDVQLPQNDDGADERLLPARSIGKLAVGSSLIDIQQDAKVIFAEEFSGPAGSIPGGVWYFFDGWGGGDWRDAIYDRNHAKLDGRGNLVLTGEPGSDGNLHTSYLQTYNQKNQDAPSPAKFGPGTYIEARIDMSGCGEVGSSSWCAFWLFDPSDPYDGNAANGTEIDIVEYTKANDWSSKRFTSSSHTINGEEHNGAWHENANPGDGFHIYGLDWQPNRLSFYFDDRKVWETTKGISGSNNQAVLLSIENQRNLWAPNTTTNSSVRMVVDYVRAYEGGKP